ncbi:YceI family protein [Nonomuraea phyllanthi]|uniref:YceI family protein n=1 Tax=Nonomuraea phyllanthi TaxID=2219224 RepID=UPI001D1469E8|nr:YceI family protein [Nonomuraea phyllanthi]
MRRARADVHDHTHTACDLRSPRPGRGARSHGRPPSRPTRPSPQAAPRQPAADSIDTNNDMRDDHLRSADFLEVQTYPTLTFTSTGIRRHGEGFLVEGDLTIKDVTRQITAEVEISGFTPGHDGVPRAGCSATFDIDRNDYNVTFSKVLETGGVMVGDRVSIQLSILAILQQS